MDDAANWLDDQIHSHIFVRGCYPNHWPWQILGQVKPDLELGGSLGERAHKTSGILDLERVQGYNDQDYHTQAFLEDPLLVPEIFAERLVAISQLGWPTLGTWVC